MVLSFLVIESMQSHKEICKGRHQMGFWFLQIVSLVDVFDLTAFATLMSDFSWRLAILAVITKIARHEHQIRGLGFETLVKGLKGHRTKFFSIEWI